MDDKRKISITLGTEKNDECKYYVYALVDENKIPFYIGKGCEERMWKHDLETEKQIEKFQLNVKELSEEAIKTLKAKNEKIAQLKGKIDHVIIKWGLTSNEALMAESSLINLLKFTSIPLTNEVNGHATEKEKCSKYGKTKAMTAKDFLDKCCRDSISYDEIEQSCLFTCINNSFNQEEYEKVENKTQYILDCARGIWRLNKNKLKSKGKKYLVAVYKSIIYAVAEIIDIREIHEDGTLEDFPIYPQRVREKDLRERNCKRKYLVCKNIDNEEISKNLVGKIILNDDKPIFPKRSAIRYSKKFK